MFRDRAIETIQAGFTGTGTYNLGGAATNSQALDAAFGSGATGVFAVRTATWSKVEFLWGVVTSGSPDTLTRNVLRSYNGSTWGTSAVNWLSGDHPLYVYSVPSGDLLASLLKTNAATSRPGWLPQWGLWLDTDTPSATVVTLNLFDGTDNIAIGTFDTAANTFTPTGLSDVLHLSGGTLTNALHITYVDSGAAGLPLEWQVNSASPAAADLLVYLNFNGRDSASNVHTYAQIVPSIADPTNGSEDGNLYISLSVAGSLSNRLNLDANGCAITGLLVSTGAIRPGNDAQFYLDYNAGSPLLNFDSTDYLWYSRGSNQFEFVIGGSAKLVVSSTVLTTTAITINAGNIALQSGAALTHAGGGNTVVDTSGHIVLRQYANVAALPSAASFPSAVVHLLSSTTPGTGPLPATSDGTNWRSGTGVVIN